LMIDSMNRRSWEDNPHVENSHLYVHELSDEPALLPKRKKQKSVVKKTKEGSFHGK